MEAVNTLMLPGLDGTDHLLTHFHRAAPDNYRMSILTLPDDPTASYDDLCDHFGDVVAATRPCTLIGESFSGPLAILLAHRYPESVRHLVLVATFVTCPITPWSKLVPWSLAFRIRMPIALIRAIIVGQHERLAQSVQQAVQVQSPRTLARRLRCVLNVDVRQPLRELQCRITCIRATEDHLVTKPNADAIAQLNPRVMSRQIEGPHLILQARPQQAWQQIVETSPAKGC
ncbi:MAG: alpha/beta hydrolase [Planctomycetota bacterium]